MLNTKNRHKHRYANACAKWGLHGMQEVIGSTPIFSTKSRSTERLFYFMSYYVYILYSTKKDKFYIGQTENVERRLTKNIVRKNLGTDDWAIKYTEAFESRALAVNREREIKNKKSRKFIEQLISSAA